MKKLLINIFLLSLIAGIGLAVDSALTNLPILGNGMSLYGNKTTGKEVQVIGVTVSDNIIIDNDAIGVSFGGALGSGYINAVSVNASVTTSIEVTQSALLFTNGATIGTSNVVLPSSPFNREIANIVSVPAITVMTVTAGSKTVNGGVTSMNANTAIAYVYLSAKSSWYKFK